MSSFTSKVNFLAPNTVYHNFVPVCDEFFLNAEVQRAENGPKLGAIKFAIFIKTYLRSTPVMITGLLPIFTVQYTIIP